MLGGGLVTIWLREGVQERKGHKQHSNLPETKPLYGVGRQRERVGNLWNDSVVQNVFNAQGPKSFIISTWILSEASKNSEFKQTFNFTPAFNLY